MLLQLIPVNYDVVDDVTLVVVVVEVNIGYVVAYVWYIVLGSGLIIIRCMFEFAIGFNH